MSVRGGSPIDFEVEWPDKRLSLPTSSDAGVFHDSTPCASVDSTRSVQGLVAILHRIVFGESQDDRGKSTLAGGAGADSAVDEQAVDATIYNGATSSHGCDECVASVHA